MMTKTDNIFDTYIVYVEDGEEITHRKGASVEADAFFTEVARALCFADYSGIEILKIVFRGQEYFYKKWQPDMFFEFEDKDGNVVWSAYVPEWEH